ncbi:mitochondrial amidoxime-reducing component 1-like [Ptychodera flava]|uniref:mitochondrial amidoxime-reducing component 1-like n=1 Tax=Ptychodera flava TaxID=63121 RepID=UPI00396A04E8
MSDNTYLKQLTVAGLAVCAFGAAWMLWRRSKQARRTMVAVGKVSGLFIYPVKSCARIEVQSGKCCRIGLISGILKDRHWMVVDGENTFMTIGKEPRMCLIQPSLSEDERYLYLDAVNMPRLKVPIDYNEIQDSGQEIIQTRVWRHDIKGKYCGKEAAEWINTFLGKTDFKLLVLDDLPPSLCSEDPKYSVFAQEGDIIAYQNNSPYLVLGEASVEDLNRRLDNPVSMKNFRPNIALSGMTAHEEDNWTFMQIGDALFRRYKYCQRCKITTVDPQTGIMHKSEPMKTMKSYRLCNDDPESKSMYGQSPLFGVNMAIVEEGTVNVGDTVYACYD